MVSPCSNRSSGVIQDLPSRSDWQLSFLHSYDNILDPSVLERLGAEQPKCAT